MPTKWILNCDDFGMHPTINEAIAELLPLGLRCSLYPTGVYFEDAVSRLRTLGRKSVGVHLALTSEYPKLATKPVLPLERVTSLVTAEGHFPTESGLLKSQVKLEEAEAELDRQIGLVLEQGLEVSHLDGHCFFYHPEEGGLGLYAVVERLSRRYRVPFRQPDSPVPFFLIWEGYDQKIQRDRYYDMLLNTPLDVPVAELILHPAKASILLESFTGAGARRVADYEYFSGERFRARLESGAILLAELESPEGQSSKGESAVSERTLPDVEAR